MKSNFNFSEAAFNDITKVFNKSEIGLFTIKKHLGLLVGIEPQIYDMCINSCCAFTGALQNKRNCKYYTKSQHYSNGKARKQLPYIFIIVCLKL